MRKVYSLLLILLCAGCATTPYDNETAAGVKIYITLGDTAKVNDITVTTSSDNAQENSTTSKQDATQSTDVSVDPSSVTPAGAAGGAINGVLNGGN